MPLKAERGPLLLGPQAVNHPDIDAILFSLVEMRFCFCSTHAWALSRNFTWKDRRNLLIRRFVSSTNIYMLPYVYCKEFLLSFLPMYCNVFAQSVQRTEPIVVRNVLHLLSV